MKYIIIELFDKKLPTIITNEKGEAIIFHNLSQAERFARDECQKGMVLPLNEHLINLLKDLRGFVDDTKCELGKEWDDANLEQRLNNLLN